MTNSFEAMMRKSLLLNIVQRDITCRLSNKVLDIDTCVVILDSDGDPFAVFAPEGYKMMLDTGYPPEQMLQEGYTFDQSTIPK